jgi:ribosomal protein L44E
LIILVRRKRSRSRSRSPSYSDSREYRRWRRGYGSKSRSHSRSRRKEHKRRYWRVALGQCIIKQNHNLIISIYPYILISILFSHCYYLEYWNILYNLIKLFFLINILIFKRIRSYLRLRRYLDRHPGWIQEYQHR